LLIAFQSTLRKLFVAQPLRLPSRHSCRDMLW